MTMKGLLAALLMLLAAAPGSAQSNVEAIQAALNVCIQTYPNSYVAQAEIEAAGFDYRGSFEPSLHIYVRDGFRGVVVTTGASAGFNGCMVTASRMKPATAIALGEAAAKQLTGVKILPPDGEMLRGWVGLLNGKPVIIGAIKNIELDIVRGAALIFRDP